ncbi:hypothetical protein CHH55_03955 [Niallia circulans]|uniref:nucleotidyltransferase family protein n=1 Tax=Niallia TaxID=2837506 RepID=UPI000BA7CE0A|nr:NTP transferase domain-containing protein [Niallia circulans]NRG31842.1 NTP transferase domain-containing protein [Niallia circulans]PAD27699.1 hypothetical protein CHH62_01160 [Niallia circulans]PAD89267.1 hypothetical protein CHH55_03955 [Niallia circulans]
MITALYLAAGNSKRMGEHKLSLPLRNETVGNHGLSVLLTSPFVDYVFVIVQPGDHLNWITPANKLFLNGKKGKVITCDEASLGQSYSLKKGFKAAIEQQAEKILVCLADQPFITHEMIDKIVTTPLLPPYKYVASMHKGVYKPPILFHPSAISDINYLEGDIGARKLLQDGIMHGEKIEFSEEECFIDIDTKNDYEKVLKRRE